MSPRTTTNGTSEYVSKTKALELLDIEASTFYVACKRHDWLREACVTEMHPETGTKWTKVRLDAIERYKAERKAGGGNHDGALKHTLWLREDEVDEAAALLGDHFGRTIEIDRLYGTEKTEPASA